MSYPGSNPTPFHLAVEFTLVYYGPTGFSKILLFINSPLSGQPNDALSAGWATHRPSLNMHIYVCFPRCVTDGGWFSNKIGRPGFVRWPSTRWILSRRCRHQTQFMKWRFYSSRFLFFLRVVWKLRSHDYPSVPAFFCMKETASMVPFMIYIFYSASRISASNFYYKTSRDKTLLKLPYGTFCCIAVCLLGFDRYLLKYWLLVSVRLFSL